MRFVPFNDNNEDKLQASYLTWHDINIVFWYSFKPYSMKVTVKRIPWYSSWSVWKLFFGSSSCLCHTMITMKTNSTLNCKTVLRSMVQGGRRSGRQRKKWTDKSPNGQERALPGPKPLPMTVRGGDRKELCHDPSPCPWPSEVETAGAAFINAAPPWPWEELRDLWSWS